MEYSDFVDQWAQKRVYSQIPERLDTWQNDVFDWTRTQIAEQWKDGLNQLTTAGVMESAQGMAMAEKIQLDVFGRKADGKYAGRPPDTADARVVQLIPDIHTEPLEVLQETMHLCAVHMAYKFNKWKATAELSELITRCEDIPDFFRTDYKAVFSVIVQVVTNAFAILHGDIKAKPNYGRLAPIAGLYKELRDYGERMWNVVGNPEEVHEEETDPRDEEWDAEDEEEY